MQAAFFDVDGTLASSDVARSYLDFQLRRSPPTKLLLWLPWFLLRVPYYYWLDSLDRARFNEAFFRNYRGVETRELESWANGAAQNFWKRRLFPAALERLEHHRAQGHRIILASGGVEPTLRPLAQLVSAEALVCARLEQRGSYYTGRLVAGPTSGLAKAEAVRKLADELGLDLTQCYAYADSFSDRDFLACVGHPTAVNADRRLRRLARERGWPVLEWT